MHAGITPLKRLIGGLTPNAKSAGICQFSGLAPTLRGERGVTTQLLLI